MVGDLSFPTNPIAEDRQRAGKIEASAESTPFPTNPIAGRSATFADRS
ncbi:hypothetical protein [Leptolyngbya sp. FACHB-1624]